MSTRFIKWHTHEELERIANEIHREFTCGVPVDIDYLIEMMGLEIHDITRLKEDFGLYGLLGKVKGKFTIFVQKGDFNLTNYNTNLTLAEELSHFLLHDKYFEDVNDIEGAHNFYVSLKKESELMMEFNAKHLAGAILIPQNSLKKEALKIYRKNEKVLRKLLKDADSIIDHLSVPLGDLYQVPQIAVSYRLKRKIIGFKEFLKEKAREEAEETTL